VEKGRKVIMAENTQLVEYESNGEMVKISPTMIRRYLVNGGGNVSDGEVMMFMSLCRYQHLNPFLREAYLIKYGSNDPATIVTGKDVFTKRANADPRYKGKKAGIVVIKKDGTVEEREGTMVLPNETIVLIAVYFRIIFLNSISYVEKIIFLFRNPVLNISPSLNTVFIGFVAHITKFKLQVKNIRASLIVFS
jgi:hypothetical protein